MNEKMTELKRNIELLMEMFLLSPGGAEMEALVTNLKEYQDEYFRLARERGGV